MLQDGVCTQEAAGDRFRSPALICFHANAYIVLNWSGERLVVNALSRGSYCSWSALIQTDRLPMPRLWSSSTCTLVGVPFGSLVMACTVSKDQPLAPPWTWTQ